ncbi:hypothetical protein OR1_02945 [Geobacter sp. OR-1]|nr:hypothetical protein OR1_02945 [Geobacter sp. OR-1]
MIIYPIKTCGLNRFFTKLLGAFVILMLTSVASAASNDSRVENATKRVSPHGVEGSCHVCHAETEERLNRWSLFSFGIYKKKLILDYNEVCRQCHGVDFGHGVGKTPRLNREMLTLDSEGTIACAITCHDMHIKSNDYIQNRYHLRFEKNRLCLSCHNK